MKKGFLMMAMLLVMVVSGFFGHSLMRVMAEEETGCIYHKYYTSIRLEEGDTLWSIAREYNVHSNKTMDQYVCELRRMNSLLDDTIHTGNYLTISYYAPEQK